MIKKIIMLSSSAVILIAIIIFSICVTNKRTVKTTNQKSNKKENNSTVLNNKETDKKIDETITGTIENDTTTEQETETQETQPVSETDTSQETTSPDVPQGMLQQNMKLENIDSTKPMVALTFDDGPCPENTNRILDELKQYNAHATFFVVGYNVDGNEDVIQRAAQDGNEIGNHTANHGKLRGIAPEDIPSLVTDLSDRIKGLTNQQYVPLRPPYGAIDDAVLAEIQDPVVLWSIDTLDWKTKNPEKTIENVQNTVFDGSIILMHDLYAESADAAIQLISWLNEQGYQMVTVSEMAYFRRGGMQTGIKYGSFQMR